MLSLTLYDSIHSNTSLHFRNSLFRPSFLVLVDGHFSSVWTLVTIPWIAKFAFANNKNNKKNLKRDSLHSGISCCRSRVFEFLSMFFIVFFNTNNHNQSNWLNFFLKTCPEQSVCICPICSPWHGLKILYSHCLHWPVTKLNFVMWYSNSWSYWSIQVMRINDFKPLSLVHDTVQPNLENKNPFWLTFL